MITQCVCWGMSFRSVCVLKDVLSDEVCDKLIQRATLNLGRMTSTEGRMNEDNLTEGVSRP